MSLKAEIEEFRSSRVKEIPNEVKNIMESNSKELKESTILEGAPQVGSKLNNFNLKNHLGESISLNSLIKDGPVVVTFYRGGWCPYCNLQLNSYQRILPQIKGLGATLVAITPELPDSSLETKERHDLEFEVLSDVESLYAKEIGVVFTVRKDLQELYAKFGHDLEKHNGKNQFDLPLASTFVVDTNGIITYAFLDTDYIQRAEPEVILNELKALKK